MRILFFADNFKPETNAPATHIYERCKLWVEAGHQVTAVTCAPNFPEGKVFDGFKNRIRSVENMDGIRVVRVKTYIAPNKGFIRRILDYVSYVPMALFFALFEKKPDVVISSSPQLFVAVAGLVYAKIRRRPHVMEVRDLWPASILATTSMKPGRIYRLLERLELFLYRHSRRLIVMTRSFVDDLTSRGVPLEKIDVVRGGASLDLFSGKTPRDEALANQYNLGDRLVVGYLGTHGLAHGLENVINTAEILREYPVVFLFVGSGAAKANTQQLAQKKGLENVVFVPRQPKEEMPRFWSVCDVALIHLRDDPLFASVIPSKIFEAMAVGVPILYVGPDGEGAEIVRQQNAGITIRSAQPDTFANEIRRLAENPPLIQRLAECSRNSAEKFSRRRHAENTLEVLVATLREVSNS